MGEPPRHLHRAFGGAPLAVILRLAVVSLIVGAVMAGFGLTPDNLAEEASRAARVVWDLGFGAAHHVGAYALMGAVIVVPVWLLMRLSGRG